jgi:hypothetical protein
LRQPGWSARMPMVTGEVDTAPTRFMVVVGFARVAGGRGGADPARQCDWQHYTPAAAAAASGLPTGDLGWGSRAFKRLGRHRVALIRRFLQFGVTVSDSWVGVGWDGVGWGLTAQNMERGRAVAQALGRAVLRCCD